MSAPGHGPDDTAPIPATSPLARALAGFAVPEMAVGFADRVIAAAEARPGASLAPLPGLRRSGGIAGWRLGRRIAIAAIGFGALATAAAATGLLERFDLPVPSPQQVWARISGKDAAPAPGPTPVPAAASVAPPADPAPAALAPVRIDGRIDTPEELAEAFRRIDEVREGRMEARRERIEARIASELERRRAAGLPLPGPEEEARLRARIEETRSRREGLLDERVAARREDLRARIEGGEAITPDDILRPLREDARAIERHERNERLRRMSPEQRREALRQLPPEQRSALIEAWRERRARRPGGGVPAAAEVPAGEATVEAAVPGQDTPAAEPPR